MSQSGTGVQEEVREILRRATRSLSSRDIFEQSKLADELVQVSAALSAEYIAGRLTREPAGANSYIYQLKAAYKSKSGQQPPAKIELVVTKPAAKVISKPKRQHPKSAPAQVAQPKSLNQVADEEVAAARDKGNAAADKLARYEQLPLTLGVIIGTLRCSDEPWTLMEIAAATGFNRGDLIFDLQTLTSRGMVVRTVAPNGQYRYALQLSAPKIEASLSASPMLAGSITEAATRSDQALIAYAESKNDPVLSALIAAAHQNWRSCAIAGVTP